MTLLSRRPIVAIVVLLLVAQGTVARVLAPCLETLGAPVPVAATAGGHATHSVHSNPAAEHGSLAGGDTGSAACDTERERDCSLPDDEGACLTMPACASALASAGPAAPSLAGSTSADLPEPPALAPAPAPAPDVPPPRA